MTNQHAIVGIGESLFDLAGDSEQLGGAPLLVAMYAQRLGNRGVAVSRVGQDRLGQAVFDALDALGMATDHLQSDPDQATGTVYVGAADEPDEIAEQAAWDFLQWDGDLDALAAHAGAVCFGSLAQRVAQSRNTIFRFVEAARRAVRLFDVSRRSVKLEARELRRSLELATAVKVNRGELGVLKKTLLLPEADDEATAQLIRTHALDWVAVTQREGATAVYTDEGVVRGDVLAGPRDADAVAAGLLHGAVRRWDWSRTIALADTLGVHAEAQAEPCAELTDVIRSLAGITSGDAPEA